MLRKLLVAALLVVASSPARAQSVLTHVQVSVAGTNDEWTPTSVTVAQGDILLIQADGKVKVGDFLGEVDADGTKDANATGHLEMKIGVSAGRKVGAHAFVVADQAGPVKLRVHDSRYEDNAGSFTVSVIQIPAAAIPQARIVQP